MNNLLPPNATPQEVALVETTERIDAIPVRSRQMWNPQTCPANLLPWLAWACSVDEWNAEWSEQQKRDTIAASFAIHSTKGTLAAVKSSLAALGYNSNITEWFQQPTILPPYTFTVDIDAGTSPISSDIFSESTRLIEQTKNTRSHLARLRVASSAPVQFYGAVAQSYGIYCAAGGALSVVGGRPLLLKANAFAVASAAANLTSLVVRYFASGHVDGDIQIWKVDGTAFTAVSDPDIKPGFESSNLIYGIDFSPNADYLVAACNQSPRIYLYKRTGDTFAKLPDPAVLPGGVAGGGARFSPDGIYLAVSGNGGLQIYQRSGDTFTKLTDPVNSMGGTSCAWNRNGDYLASSSGNTFPYIYSRSGTIFTKIANPTTELPNRANGMAFSPISDLLICAHEGAPFISVSSITGGVHTRHANPAVLPTSTAKAVAINPAGNIAVVGFSSAPYLLVYTIAGTTLTKLPDPAVLPDSQVNSLAFNAEGTVLTVGFSSEPYLVTYSVSGTTLTQISNPPSIPATAIFGSDFS
jgi:phage tail P2-like protein